MYRKFFSPSFVIAEGQTLHSIRGSVRHAIDGTPPASKTSIFVLKDGGVSIPEVPVPSMMRETARGYLVGDTPFWGFPIDLVMAIQLRIPEMTVSY